MTLRATATPQHPANTLALASRPRRCFGDSVARSRPRCRCPSRRPSRSRTRPRSHPMSSISEPCRRGPSSSSMPFPTPSPAVSSSRSSSPTSSSRASRDKTSVPRRRTRSCATPGSGPAQLSWKAWQCQPQTGALVGDSVRVNVRVLSFGSGAPPSNVHIALRGVTTVPNSTMLLPYFPPGVPITVTIPATKDTTIYERNTAGSNGAGQFMWAGRDVDAVTRSLPTEFARCCRSIFVRITSRRARRSTAWSSGSTSSRSSERETRCPSGAWASTGNGMKATPTRPAMSSSPAPAARAPRIGSIGA